MKIEMDSYQLIQSQAESEDKTTSTKKRGNMSPNDIVKCYFDMSEKSGKVYFLHMQLKVALSITFTGLMCLLSTRCKTIPETD